MTHPAELAVSYLSTRYDLTGDPTHRVPTHELVSYLKRQHSSWGGKPSQFFSKVFADLNLGTERWETTGVRVRTGIRKTPRKGGAKVYKPRPPPDATYLLNWFEDERNRLSRTGTSTLTAKDFATLFITHTRTRLGRDLALCPFATKKRTEHGILYSINWDWKETSA